jgi:hypothetical protein
MAERREFGSQLAKFAYRGPFEQFAGPRWWTLGIERFLWEITDGNPGNRESVRSALADFFPATWIPKSYPANSVVCYNEDFLPEARVVDAEHAVRVAPDDWPGYALQPWVRTELARENNSIRMLVVKQDSDRVKN